MFTFQAKARTTTDGTLSLAIPTGLPDTDVEVLVVIDVAQRLAPQPRELSKGWPVGYFEEYFGALRDEGVVRHPQSLPGDDVFEERERIN
jgi:hypothetical protein